MKGRNGCDQTFSRTIIQLPLTYDWESSSRILHRVSAHLTEHLTSPIWSNLFACTCKCKWLTDKCSYWLILTSIILTSRRYWKRSRRSDCFSSFLGSSTQVCSSSTMQSTNSSWVDLRSVAQEEVMENESSVHFLQYKSVLDGFLRHLMKHFFLCSVLHPQCPPALLQPQWTMSLENHWPPVS